MAIGTNGWNLADLWETVARQLPNSPAIIQGPIYQTWERTNARADALAHRLMQEGLNRQDKVAQYLYNCPEYLESVFASFKASFVPVNTNYRYRGEELLYLWDNADVVAVIFQGTFSSTIDSIRQKLNKVRLWLWVDDHHGPCPGWAVPYESAVTKTTEWENSPTWQRSGDDLYLLYTGGTTGSPKGVMWRQEDLFFIGNRTAKLRYPAEADAAAVANMLQESGPRHLLSCPLMHGNGSFSSFQAWASGGSVALLRNRRFDATELLDTAESVKANSMMIVGDVIAKPIVAALKANAVRWDLESLRVISSSGAMWSESVKEELTHYLPNAILVDTLGSSEAFGLAASVSRGKGSGAKTARFIVSDETRVLAENGHWVEPGSDERGLVARKGPTSIGYYKDDSKTAATYKVIDGDRWSIPGDFAMVEADGSLKLLGRGSSCINTGGEKVYPEEVEEELKLDNAVRDALVLGIADDRFGEIVTAVVVLESGYRFDAQALELHLRSRLAGYKIPRTIQQVESLERGDSGKIDYQEWSRRLQGDSESETPIP